MHQVRIQGALMFIQTNRSQKSRKGTLFVHPFWNLQMASTLVFQGNMVKLHLQ
ncbi:hypothetical protein ES332_D01G060200v1 [Gossypium tomentosum]|uniref:Uncharacterized protein n=1 Tax=Gossypium tomentosum TaxID=34277 RepID=A0A5D2M671_GOSTO|nr:hypothetical protein ES332_D01G060200v1 [Gossypium tomentosum]